MSYVTYETAVLLESVGFPEPEEFKVGSFYWTDQEPCIVVPEFLHETALLSLESGEIFTGSYSGKYLFAPTVSDTLLLIGNNALIKFRKDETGQIFECNIDEGDGRERLLGYHETNPAEAAAMAWLKLNETPKS